MYKVNNKYFIYGLACGLISDASYKAEYNDKKYFGKLAYDFKALSNISNSAVNLVTSASYFAISFGFAFSNPLAVFSLV
jgi:hypothetical protein